MKKTLDKNGTPDSLKKAVNECITKFAAKGLLILSADANNFTPESLNPVLKEIPVPFIGGTFPAIIYGSKLLERGSVVAALPHIPQIQVISGLSGENEDFDDLLDEDLLEEEGQTMLVLVDGMSKRVNTLLFSLFNIFGLEINYLGGGAGSLDIEPKACLMTKDGLIGDAAILAVLKSHSGIGVNHGMKSVAGPFKITSARQNEICTIDWQPAHDYFKKVIHQVSPDLKDESEFPVSREFCVAVNRIGDEKVVRDPTKILDDGSLHVAPEVKEGEFVDIVRADKNSTIQAAYDALALARKAYSIEKLYDTILCFDCSGRWKFLGESYQEELAAFQEKGKDVLGVLTIGGEIANNGMDFLDYYNRTCVIGVIED